MRIQKLSEIYYLLYVFLIKHPFTTVSQKLFEVTLRNLTFGVCIGWAVGLCRCAILWCDLDLIFDLAVVTDLSDVVQAVPWKL